MYELAIPHEIKAEIIREHLNLIIKMLGKDIIKIIKDRFILKVKYNK